MPITALLSMGFTSSFLILGFVISTLLFLRTVKINASSRDLFALASRSVDELTNCGGTNTPSGLLNKWLEIRELVIKGLKDSR
jgi:hypothetical protein